MLTRLRAAAISPLLRRTLASSTVKTAPNSTIRIVGACGRLSVGSNMETDVAELTATLGGVECPWADVVQLETTEEGDALNLALDVGVAEGTNPRSLALAVTVPSAFNVAVEMAPEVACDVDIKGWLEGTVHVAAQGSVTVGTVRGMLCSVESGRGDVSVKTIDGNLTVKAACGGVKLGKIMGEEVKVDAAGAVSSKALYGKEVEIRAGGGLSAAVLSAEAGFLELGGASTLDQLEGEVDVRLAAGGELVAQGSGGLRQLRVVRHEAFERDGGDAGGAGPGGGGDGGAITINLPPTARARATLLGGSVSIDEALQPRDVPPAAASAMDIEGVRTVALGADEAGGRRRRRDGGQAVASATATWADGGGGGGGGGGEGKGEGEGAWPCELLVLAPECSVNVAAQDWFAQRIKGLGDIDKSGTMFDRK